jgi:hypothetical protein
MTGEDKWLRFLAQLARGLRALDLPELEKSWPRVKRRAARAWLTDLRASCDQGIAELKALEAKGAK